MSTTLMVNLSTTIPTNSGNDWMKQDYSISTKEPPTAEELHPLFRQAEWAKERTLEDTQKLLNTMDVFVTIRDEDVLIGFGRALTDGVFRAVLDDIIVEENYRGQGVGVIIVETLMDQLPEIEEILLHAEKDLEGFYNRFGFKLFHGLTMNFRADWQ